MNGACIDVIHSNMSARLASLATCRTFRCSYDVCGVHNLINLGHGWTHEHIPAKICTSVLLSWSFGLELWESQPIVIPISLSWKRVTYNTVGNAGGGAGSCRAAAGRRADHGDRVWQRSHLPTARQGHALLNRQDDQPLIAGDQPQFFVYLLRTDHSIGRYSWARITGQLELGAHTKIVVGDDNRYNDKHP